MAADSEVVAEVAESVDEFGLLDLVEGLGAYCLQRATEDDGLQAKDWRRASSLFSWLQGKLEDLDLE